MEDNKAKMSILKEMRKMAMDDMGEGLKGGLKKVTVAAPSSKGLQKGLDTAEDMVEDMPMGKDMSMDMDNAESPNADYDEETHQKLQELVDSCQSSEDIDKKIEFLENAKQEKFGENSYEMPEPIMPDEGMEE